MLFLEKTHEEWAALSGLTPATAYSLADHAMAALVAEHGVTGSLADLISLGLPDGEEPPPDPELPTIVGHTNAFGTGTATRTLTPHASTATGDLMVAIFATNAQLITPPVGWTQRVSATTGTMQTQVFTKVRGAAETTYDFTIAASATDTHALVTINGTDEADLIVGADGIRSVNGTATTSVAPSITTTSAMTLALVITTDRSTTTEAAVSGVSGATPYVFIPQNGATGLETIWIGTIEQTTAGATGNVTVTYPNSQASNGFGVQLGLPPVS